MHHVNSDQFLKQAIALFNKIRKKIELLIDCSAQDFDILNQSFQSYHQLFKELTSQTDKLLNNLVYLTDSFLAQNNTLTKASTQISNGIHASCSSNRVMSLVTKEISYIFLHINKLKQNISTLRLLTTNMKFEPRYSSIYQDIITFLDELLSSSNDFDQELQKIESKFKNCLSLYARVCVIQFPKVLKAYNNHLSDFDNLISQKSGYQEQDATLLHLATKKTSSSANIVTNLQFQDIIRQKIEHVQEAQGKLLQKLNDPKPAEVSTDPNSYSLHIIFQTRNIALLQAAQLIHANTEYQKAIETIMAGFEELDQVVLQATKVLHNLYQDPIFASNLRSSFCIFKDEYLQLHKLNSELQHNYTEIFRENHPLTLSTEKLDKTLRKSKALVRQLHAYKSEVLVDKHLINPFNQLQSNFEKYLRNASETNTIISNNQKRIQREILPGMEEYFNQTLKLEKTVKGYFVAVEDLLPKTDISISQNELNRTNHALNETEFDSNKLHYFKVFEKEIELITDELDSLCNQIDFKKLEAQFNPKDLAHFQELYTMDSEREVHAMITGEEFTSSTTNDDIELF